MATSDLLNEQTALIEESNSLLSMLMDKAGKYVWKKYKAEVLTLPEGYTALNYIQSSGTQYINTRFKPNQDTKVICDAEWTAVSSTTNNAMFGSRKSSSEQGYYWAYMTTGKCRSGYGANYNYEFDVASNTRHTVVKDKNKTTVGEASHAWDYTSFQSDYPIFLFALNEAGTPTWYSTGKTYSYEAYDNGVIACDYVPCINPNGNIGMYDFVNSAFEGNSGSGEFTAGEIVQDYKKTRVGDFVSYVVSDDSNSHPAAGLGDDGYWYEALAADEAPTIAYGFVAPSSSATEIKVMHGLDEAPTYGIIFRASSLQSLGHTTLAYRNEVFGFSGTNEKFFSSAASCEITSDYMLFKTNMSSFATNTHIWVAIV